MSSLFSSPNSLVLIGVGILAVLIIFLAIWLARVSSRAAKERAKVEAIEQRLAHIEDYLSRVSRSDLAPGRADDEERPKTVNPVATGAAVGGVKPVSKPKSKPGSSGASRHSDEREAKQSRRSKRQPVIPYGEAKESVDDVYGGARQSTANANATSAASSGSMRQGAARPMEIAGRQSVTRDARRRREERRQDQIRRQAESIVQGMQQSDAASSSSYRSARSSQR